MPTASQPSTSRPSEPMDESGDGETEASPLNTPIKA